MTDSLPNQNRTWEMICHLASLVVLIGVPFGHILGPLVVWLIKRNESPSIDENGKESLNFQISMTLYLLFASAVTFSLLFILIGFLLLPFLVLLVLVAPVINLIFVIIAAIKASNGEPYRYPLTLRLIG